jgi:hypothetical protein
MRRVLKISGILVANAVLIVVLCELGAALYGQVALGHSYRNIGIVRDEVRSFLPGAVANDVQGATVEELAYNQPRRLHPLFGFTYNRAQFANSANNFGFIEQEDFPYQAKPGEFVVGIFGGSFAQGLKYRDAYRATADGILELVKPHGYETVKILSFAQGNYRQPITLFTFLYYCRTVDLAIFIEGYNELAGLPDDQRDARPNRPVDFPSWNIYEALAKPSLDMGALVTRIEIDQIRAKQRNLLAAVSRAPWRYSMLAHVYWQIRHNAWEREAARSSDALTATTSDDFGLIDYGSKSTTDIVADYFEEYAARIRAAWLIGQANGVPVFHFLQPNQYYEGSKAFSEVERQTALGRMDDPGSAKINRYYPRLREMSARLRDEGIPAYDLTMLFADNSETLYKDSCCHMNDRGMELVAEAVVRHIAESGHLAP